jgi:hypothetical protein
MTFDEKSGQYSLIECIRLTKSKYASARLAFAARDAAEFPEFLNWAKTVSRPAERAV